MVEIGGFSKITKAYIFSLQNITNLKKKLNADPIISFYKILFTRGGCSKILFLDIYDDPGLVGRRRISS